MSDDRYTIPGLAGDTASAVMGILERRLVAFVDLALTLKHVHWNVVGPGFIAVHEMLDPQGDAVREMVDEIAERIDALGGSPRGTPGSVVEGRHGDDYALARATVPDHLAALDGRYATVIEETRAAQRPWATSIPCPRTWSSATSVTWSSSSGSCGRISITPRAN